MNRLTVLASLVLVSAPATAQVHHDWYAVKTKDGNSYFYDLASVENADGPSVKSVALYERDGATQDLFYIDCATARATFFGSISDNEWVMTEGQLNASSWRHWAKIPETGVMSVAADVACLHYVRGAIHAESLQDAIDKLKTLSN